MPYNDHLTNSLWAGLLVSIVFVFIVWTMGFLWWAFQRSQIDKRRDSDELIGLYFAWLAGLEAATLVCGLFVIWALYLWLMH